MNDEIIIPELNNETIESMICEIRGVKVMLDFDLARIYGYETRAFNQQIQRNINKFDNDFMFQLTKKEFELILMSQNVTSSWGGTRKLPFAFTEQGIYMLMTVLKGELAVKQSKAIIRLFKQMKDYLVESNNLLSSEALLKLTTKVYTNEKNIEKLKMDNRAIKKKLEVVMDNFIDPSTYKHFVLFNGEKIEADVIYQMIYKLAKKSIYIIDDYIDIKTLQLLKCCSDNVYITIFSDNKGKNNLNYSFINDFLSETNFKISFKHTHNAIHDRYIILDYDLKTEKIYHCGASSKDAGLKINTIMKITDIDLYSDVIEKLLKNDEFVF